MGSEAAAHPLAGAGLFVLGCARSGTTILQNALNDSGEVFLFGEPDFHTDPGTPDFATRYNAMHRSWSNQATKSTFCPPVFSGDAAWSDYLAALSAHYKRVGAKIVLNAGSEAGKQARLLAFQCQRFYRSHYIFTFRDPLAMAQSIQAFQVMTGGEVAPFEVLMASYVDAVSLCILMLRNLPHVDIVFHDAMNRRTFARLERRLQVRLSGAHRYYDPKRVRLYDPAPVLRAHGDQAQLVLDLYRDFRTAAMKGFDLIQLEQNSANPLISHLTPLGHLARRCEVIADAFARGAIPGGSAQP